MPGLATPAYLKMRRPALLDLGGDPRNYYSQQLTALKAVRSPFEQEMREIGDYIRVRRVKLYGDSGAAYQRSNKVINNQATLDSRILRAGMYSGLSSPSRPWLRLTTPDKDLAEYPRVKSALGKRADMLALIFQKSNFYPTIHESYGLLGDFGNSCELIEDDYNTVVRFCQYTTGEYYYGVNYENKINRVYREIDMQVSDLVDKFNGNVSRTVMNLYDRGEYGALVKVIHAIEPNRDVIRGAKGVQGRPFVEVYLEASASGGDGEQGMLSISGYKTWPLMAGRWDVIDGATYGSGVGLETIGDVKALQTLELRKAQVAAKLAQFNIRAPSTQKRALVDHSIGGVTYYDPAQGPENVPQPLYTVNPQSLAAMTVEIEATENRIDRAYYVDMFQMIARMEGVQPRNELEISERNGERFLQIGPVLDRLHAEKLNVLVARTYQRCEDAGLFEPLPDEVADQPLRVEYISILAQAQKAAGITGIERVAGFVGNLAAIYPEVRHKLNAPQAVDEYSDMIGVEPSVIRSDDEYDQLVAAEQKAQQEAAAGAAGVAGADAAKVLSETDTSRPSALTDILSRAGGYTGAGY